MARKKSLWSELQHEPERRQRVTDARERMNEQTMKQRMHDHDRAERQDARADASPGSVHLSGGTSDSVPRQYGSRSGFR
jgi:hypothetical protein